jgi:hypothetical protein
VLYQLSYPRESCERNWCREKTEDTSPIEQFNSIIVCSRSRSRLLLTGTVKIAYQR